MADVEPIRFPGHRSGAGPFDAGSSPSSPSSVALEPRSFTAFNRRELNQILAVYGRKVASGEWRDYAIDMGRDTAVFSVFRRTSEIPLYRIEKSPRLARKQGAYSIVTATGLIVKRGHDLARVLGVFEKAVRVVV